MEKYKIKTIEYLKGIMALGIVIFHYNKFTLTAHNDNNFPLFNILSLLYTNAGILVELFFLISGFCFFEFYLEDIRNNKINGKDFFKRRFFKLYPLYIITTITILILQFFYLKKYNCLFDGGVKLDNTTIILNILCLSRGWTTNIGYPYNGPAWFLNVIILDYIIFYFISKFIKSNKIQIVIMLALIILGLIFKMHNLQYPMLNVEMGRGLTNFFLGGIVAYICNSNWIKRRKHIKAILSLIILGLMIIISSIGFESSYYAIILIGFPSILLFSILMDKYIPKLKILSFLGRISFSMYLWHYCYMCFIKILPINFNYYSVNFFIMYLVTLTGLSYISYAIIEQKLSKYLYQKFINKIE